MAGSDPVIPSDGLNTDGLDLDRLERMIVVTVEPDVADLVSDRFWQLGVRAVREVTCDDGSVEVTSSVGNDPGAISRAVATFDPAWAWRVEEVSTAASDEWRRHARPVEYRPGFVMVPAWLDPGHAIERTDDGGVDGLVTLVEPGSAFGLGDHPTTRGSMGLLCDLLTDDARPVGSVLDVGCGTGVLAVLAAQLDVADVRAVDVSDAAITATTHNARLNGVADRIVADTTPLAEVDGDFDVVVANILAPVLVALADDLRRVTAPDGALVISGVLASRHDHVLAALAPMTPVRSETDGGWITIELRH